MTTLIHNALIVDGTGEKAFTGDILIEGDRIKEVFRGSSPSNLTADNVIDSTNLVCSPGFIDAHSHSDAYLIVEPEALSKITQGITTEINGQCGGSIAPRYGQARLSSDWKAVLGDLLTWHTLEEYREKLSIRGCAVNTVQFIGHNTLRSSVVGYDNRKALPHEVARMQYLLEESIEQGAWGLSTGLIYPPGRYSTPEEVVGLAKIAAKKNLFYSTHMRSEGDRIEESVDEVVDLVRLTGIRAEISHIKTLGEKNWDKIDKVLDKVEQAISQSLLIGSDRYPYCAASTDLDIVINDDGTIDDRDWSKVIVGGTWHNVTRNLSGKSVKQCAQELGGVSPEDAVRFIVSKDEGKTGAFFFMMCEKNLDKILSRDWVLPGSDASLRSPYGILSQDFPHPRAYGTMPTFYRRLRRLGFSLEQAVKRMTLDVANRFEIKSRGVIKKGAYADVIVWDANSFKACSTYENPHLLSEGLYYAIINGEVSSFCDGKASVACGGRFLERS